MKAQLTAKYDSLLRSARKLELKGQRGAAKRLAETLLTDNAAGNDARIFHARLLAYNRDYSASIAELKRALSYDHKNIDAYIALSSVCRWAGRYNESVSAADSGLTYAVNNAELLLSKAKSRFENKEYELAKQALIQILSADPNNAEALKLLQEVKKLLFTSHVAASYYNTSFDPELKPVWHYGSLEYMRKIKSTPFIVRLNGSSRYNTSGWQMEADAYPKLGKKRYAYITTGYSSQYLLFPTFRLGLDIYQGLPKGFEAAIGGRYMNYNGSKAYVAFGQLGKYYKRTWFDYRAFAAVTPSRTFVSHVVDLRLYGRTEQDYVNLTLAYGNIPYIISSITDLARLSSKRAGIDVQRTAGIHFVLKAGFIYDYEEFYPGLFRNRFNPWTMVIYKF